MPVAFPCTSGTGVPVPRWGKLPRSCSALLLCPVLAVSAALTLSTSHPALMAFTPHASQLPASASGK